MIPFPILHFFFVILGIVASFFHSLGFLCSYHSFQMPRPIWHMLTDTLSECSAAVPTGPAPRPPRGRLPRTLFFCPTLFLEPGIEPSPWDCPVLPSWGLVSSIPCFSLSVYVVPRRGGICPHRESMQDRRVPRGHPFLLRALFLLASDVWERSRRLGLEP